MLPALPGIGTTINGARLWVKVGPLQFQPGELAKIALIVFLAGYLREKREVLAQGRLKDFGPLLADLGRGDARARRDERPRQRAPLLRDLPGDALRRDRARALRRDRARALRRRRGGRVPGVAARRRSASTSGSTRGRTRTATGYQLVQSPYSIAQRRLLAAPASAAARSRPPAAPT